MTAKPTPNRPRRYSRTGLLTSLLLLSAGALPAQTAPKTDPKNDEVVTLSAFNVSDTRTSAYNAREATSTTRISVPIQDVAQTVSVVTREVLDDTLGGRMLDAAQYVTPVKESSLSTGGDRVTLRGFQVTQRFVDGVNISGVDGYNMSSATANIERIEIIKGPNAILVPGGSPGGVMNQITKSPKFTDFTQYTVTLKEYIGSEAFVDLNRTFDNKKSAVRVVANVWDSDGYFIDQFRQGGLFAVAFTHQFGNDVVFTSKLETLYNKETQGIGAVIDPRVGTSTGGYARIIAGMPRNNAWGPKTDNRERRETRWLNELDFKLGQNTSARLWLMADHANREDWGAPGGVPAAGYQGNRNPLTGEWVPLTSFAAAAPYTASPLVYNSSTIYNRSGQGNYLNFDELHFKNDYAYEREISSSVKSATILGLSANYQKVTWKNWNNTRAPLDLANPVRDTPILTSTLLRDKVGAQQDLQAFVFERLSLFNEKLFLTGGASRFYGTLERLDDGTLPAVVARSLSNSVTDANLGVVYKPVESISLFSGYNKVGGALPSSILAGEQPKNFLVQTGNQLEAGVKSTFMGGRSSLAFSVFDIKLDNFQVPNSAFNTDPTQPQFLFQNLTSKGWEIEGSIEVTHELSFIGNFTGLKTRDPNGVRQRMVPDSAGALFARYKFSNDTLKGFSVNLGLDYMGSAPGEQASGVTAASTAAHVIPNQPSFYLAPRTIANLGFGYEHKDWTVRVVLGNVTNKSYIQSAGSRNTLVAGLPFNWSTSITYKY